MTSPLAFACQRRASTSAPFGSFAARRSITTLVGPSYGLDAGTLGGASNPPPFEGGDAPSVASVTGMRSFTSVPGALKVARRNTPAMQVAVALPTPVLLTTDDETTSPFFATVASRSTRPVMVGSELRPTW